MGGVEGVLAERYALLCSTTSGIWRFTARISASMQPSSYLTVKAWSPFMNFGPIDSASREGVTCDGEGARVSGATCGQGNAGWVRVSLSVLRTNDARVEFVLVLGE